MKNKINTCEVKRCNRESELIYYKKEVCTHHWNLHCEGIRFNLKRKLSIVESC